MNSEHELQLKRFASEVKRCTDDLKSHIQDEKIHVAQIKDDVRIIKENHLAHLEKDSAVNTNNIAWLIDNHKSMRNAVYGAFASGIIGLIINLAK